MSPKPFPAATATTAAIVAITVLTLSLPNAGAESRVRPRTRPRSVAAASRALRAEVSPWHQLLALFGLDGTTSAPAPPVQGTGGCEMDPDGVVHLPPPPKTCT